MALLEFSFNTGSVSLTRIVNAIAVTYSYQDTIPDPANPGQTIPNPETKAEFARGQIRRMIVEAVHNAERQEAMRTAAEAITPINLT